MADSNNLTVSVSGTEYDVIFGDYRTEIWEGGDEVFTVPNGCIKDQASARGAIVAYLAGAQHGEAIGRNRAQQAMRAAMGVA